MLSSSEVWVVPSEALTSGNSFLNTNVCFVENAVTAGFLPFCTILYELNLFTSLTPASILQVPWIKAELI